jgi:hypothetical protein
MPTKHDKAKLVTKHFNEILAMQVQEVVVDTDVFGTFSGEIERVGTPLENAVKKARVGIENTGNPFAIASEGSVGPDPLFGFINANIETMVFVDNELGIQVHETIKSNEIVAATTTTIKSNLEEFLKKADFPNHGLIVKPNSGQGAIKGIRDLLGLEDAIKKSVTKKNYDASLSSYGFEYRMVTGDELKQLVKKNVDDYRQLLLRYK